MSNEVCLTVPKMALGQKLISMTFHTQAPPITEEMCKVLLN